MLQRLTKHIRRRYQIPLLANRIGPKLQHQLLMLIIIQTIIDQAVENRALDIVEINCVGVIVLDYSLPDCQLPQGHCPEYFVIVFLVDCELF